MTVFKFKPYLLLIKTQLLLELSIGLSTVGTQKRESQLEATYHSMLDSAEKFLIAAKIYFDLSKIILHSKICKLIGNCCSKQISILTNSFSYKYLSVGMMCTKFNPDQKSILTNVTRAITCAHGMVSLQTSTQTCLSHALNSPRLNNFK